MLPTSYNIRVYYASVSPNLFHLKKVGIVTFSDMAKVQFYLNDFKDKMSMEDSIKKIKSEGGITNTHLAIEVSSFI